MSRSRILFGGFIVGLLMVALSLPGWGGPPPGGDRMSGPAGAGAVPPGPGQFGQPGGTGDTGAGPGGGLTMQGGAGSGSVPDQNGGSAGVKMSDLNLQRSLTYVLRAAYMPNLSGSLSNFRVGADFLTAAYTGSTDSYSGNVSTIPFGSPVDTKYNVGVLQVNVDYLTDFYACLKMGPRFQYQLLSDRMSVSYTGGDHASTTSASNIGIGGAGSIDLAKAFGFGGYENQYGEISPRLCFALSVGGSKQMRYFEWEAFLNVFKTKAGADSKIPELTASIGYMQFNFDEMKGTRAGSIAGTGEEGNLRFKFGVPMITGGVVF